MPDCITLLETFPVKRAVLLRSFFLMSLSDLAAAPHPQNCFSSFLCCPPVPFSPLIQIPITHFSVWLPKDKHFFFLLTVLSQGNSDSTAPFGQAPLPSPLLLHWDMLSSVRISNAILSTFVKLASMFHLALAGGKCL